MQLKAPLRFTILTRSSDMLACFRPLTELMPSSQSSKPPSDMDLQKARDWQFTGPLTKLFLLVRFWLKLGPDPRPPI